MAQKRRKTKFTHTLFFKVLCGAAMIVVMGLIYYFAIAEDKPAPTQEVLEEELQRKADLDTLDIIGNYLWPNMRLSKEDLLTTEEKTKDETDSRTGNEATYSKKNPESEGASKAAPVPEPATVPTQPQDIQVKSAAPSIEKVTTPHIEQIE